MGTMASRKSKTTLSGAGCAMADAAKYDEGNEPHTSSFGSLYLTTQVAKGGEREPADSLRSSTFRTPEAPRGHQIA